MVTHIISVNYLQLGFSFWICCKGHDFDSLILCRSVSTNTRKYEIILNNMIWGNMHIAKIALCWACKFHYSFGILECANLILTFRKCLLVKFLNFETLKLYFKQAT